MVKDREIVRYVIDNACQNYVEKRVIKSRDLKEYSSVLTDKDCKLFVGDLTDREKNIIEAQINGSTLTEWGEKQSISRERARQISDCANFKIVLRIISDIRTISDYDDFVSDNEIWRKMDDVISKNATIAEVSEKTGISAPTIAGLKKGNIKMSAMDVYTISKALGVTVVDMLTPTRIALGIGG